MRVLNLVSMITVLFLAAGFSVSAVSAQGLTQIDNKVFGAPAERIFVLKGAMMDTVFITTGRDLKAFGVSHGSPGSPTAIADLDYHATENILDLHVKPPYIFLATNSGVIIKQYGVPTPYTVAGLSGIPISAITTNNALTRAYVGIAIQDSGFKILDISNPASVSILGGDTLTAGRVTALAHRNGGGNDTLFVAAEGMGGGAFMRVYDVTTQTYLTHAAIGVATYYEDIIATDDSIYVAERDFGYRVFYRYGAPPIMSANSSVPVDSGANWIELMGDSVVAVSNKNGLYVIDAKTGQPLSGPTFINNSGPREIASNTYNGIAKIYGAFHAQGLQVLSLPTKATQPYQEGSGYPTGDYIYDAVARQEYAYLGNGSSGLRVVNLSTQTEVPGSPFTFAGAGGMHYVHLATEAGFLYAADWGGQICILNLSNPASPAYIASFSNASIQNVTDLEVADSVLVIADSYGAHLVDISTPSSPSLMGGGISAVGGYRDIRVEDEYVYGARNSGGFDIWNISNPISPSFGGSATGVGTGVFDTDGETAFFASNDSIYFLDVTNPASIINRGSLIELMGRPVSSLALTGNYLHVGFSEPGGGRINIYSVADTTNIFVADSAMVGAPPQSLVIDGLFLHATARGAGYYYYSDAYGAVRVALGDKTGLPQDTLSVPLGLFDNPSSLGAISFEMAVTFDTTFLSFIDASSRGALSAGLDSLVSNLIHTGMQRDTVKIAWADTASISGPDTMLILRFRIRDNAPVQPLIQITGLDIEDMVFNEGYPAVDAYAGDIRVIPRFGDADQNGLVSPPDASRILQWVTGIPPEPPMILADVSYNGEIRAYDAALILKKQLNTSFRFPIEDYFGIYYKGGAGRTEDNTRIVITSDYKKHSPAEPSLDNSQIVYSIEMRDVNEVYSAEMFIDFGKGQEFIDCSLPPELGHFSLEYRKDGTRVHVAAAGSEPITEDVLLIQFLTRLTGDAAPEPIEVIEFYLNESRITAIEGAQSAVPKTYALEQNYPNPFNPVTRIRYQLPSDSRISLIIYNILGQEVRRLIDNSMQPAGFYSLQWDGKDEFGNSVASGVYFYRIRAGGFSKTMKMLFLK